MALNDSKKLVELDFRIVGDKMYNAALQKAENATDRFGNKLGTVIGVQNTQLTKSLDSTGKRTQKLSAEFLHAGGAVTKSTAQMKNGMVSVTATTKNMGDAAKKSTGMTNDFTRALKRVIVVVPLWASLRMVMSAVTTTIKEGVNPLLQWQVLQFLSRIKPNH